MSISTTSPSSADKYIKQFKNSETKSYNERLLEQLKGKSEYEKQKYRLVTLLECKTCKARFKLKRPDVIDTAYTNVENMERRVKELKTELRCQYCGGRCLDLSDEQAVKQAKEEEIKQSIENDKRFWNSPMGQETKRLQEELKKRNE